MKDGFDSYKLDDLFSALGHPARRTILDRLAHGEATVSEIAAPFDASLNAISRHLKVLEHAGLIRREIRGREHFCQLNPDALNDAVAWLEYHRQFWNQRLDAMETALRNQRMDRHTQTETKANG